MTDFNYDLLQDILTKVEQHPALFDMCHFENHTDCGTTYCIGGWSCYLTNAPISEKHALDALRLEPSAGQILFYEFNNEQALKVMRTILRAKGKMDAEEVIETLFNQYLKHGLIAPFDYDEDNTLSLSQ
jgi:hypothetical protein